MPAETALSSAHSDDRWSSAAAALASWKERHGLETGQEHRSSFRTRRRPDRVEDHTGLSAAGIHSQALRLANELRHDFSALVEETLQDEPELDPVDAAELLATHIVSAGQQPASELLTLIAQDVTEIPAAGDPGRVLEVAAARAAGWRAAHSGLAIRKESVPALFVIAGMIDEIIRSALRSFEVDLAIPGFDPHRIDVDKLHSEIAPVLAKQFIDGACLCNRHERRRLCLECGQTHLKRLAACPECGYRYDPGDEHILRNCGGACSKACCVEHHDLQNWDPTVCTLYSFVRQGILGFGQRPGTDASGKRFRPNASDFRDKSLLYPLIAYLAYDSRKSHPSPLRSFALGNLLLVDDVVTYICHECHPELTDQARRTRKPISLRNPALVEGPDGYQRGVYEGPQCPDCEEKTPALLVAPDEHLTYTRRRTNRFIVPVEIDGPYRQKRLVNCKCGHQYRRHHVDCPFCGEPRGRKDGQKIWAWSRRSSPTSIQRRDDEPDPWDTTEYGHTDVYVHQDASDDLEWCIATWREDPDRLRALLAPFGHQERATFREVLATHAPDLIEELNKDR